MTSPVLDSNTGVDLFADYEDGQTLTGAAAPVAVTQREVPGSDQLKEVRVAAIVANAPAQTRGRANATGTYFDPEHSLMTWPWRTASKNTGRLSRSSSRSSPATTARGRDSRCSA